MFNIHWRYHEFGTSTKPRIRVWTDQMIGYGSFRVVEWEDFVTTIRTLHHLGFKSTLHTCDGLEECDCDERQYHLSGHHVAFYSLEAALEAVRDPVWKVLDCDQEWRIVNPNGDVIAVVT